MPSRLISVLHKVPVLDRTAMVSHFEILEKKHNLKLFSLVLYLVLYSNGPLIKNTVLRKLAEFFIYLRNCPASCQKSGEFV